jgi:hypothetical protein
MRFARSIKHTHGLMILQPKLGMVLQEGDRAFLIREHHSLHILLLDDFAGIQGHGLLLVVFQVPGSLPIELMQRRHCAKAFIIPDDASRTCAAFSLEELILGGTLHPWRQRDFDSRIRRGQRPEFGNKFRQLRLLLGSQPALDARQHVLSFHVSCFRGQSQPFTGLDRVQFDTITDRVAGSEVELGFRIVSLRSLHFPLNCFCIICSDTLAEKIAAAELILRLGISRLGVGLQFGAVAVLGVGGNHHSEPTQHPNLEGRHSHKKGCEAHKVLGGISIRYSNHLPSR